MNKEDKRYAVLIDADNVSDKYVEIILDELSNYGVATYKRIYGDWTKSQFASWKKVLLEHSITPIQQYSYTTGKNATDAAMIIDAMDILYSGRVDGFCLVTSDSDFTRLASRLRESGMLVLGMGEKKTPTAFIAACNKFKYLEILAQPAENSAPRRQTEEMTPLETVKAAVLSIMDEISDEDEWVSISEIGSRLNKRYPDFDVRNYGFRKLTPFIKSLGILDIRSVPVNEGNSRQVYVKVRSQL